MLCECNKYFVSRSVGVTRGGGGGAGGGGGGRAAESRARMWRRDAARGGGGADQYLALPGQRRARPSASRTTTRASPATPPTTRLFNTWRI